MAVITVRLPERLKKEMRKLKGVNWSALVRDAIESRISLEARRAERDWDRVGEAARLTDSIFEEMREKHRHIDYNSAETIRNWREKRSGPTYWTRRSR
jgi:metal-responsive CopG/Arc/MetJ family transcriptional regulator